MSHITPEVRGYHYTNTRAYESMRTGWTYDKKGLLPIRRLISLGRGIDLPEQAHAGVIEGLLEPEPSSWIYQSEFPDCWSYLLGDIVREQTMLLSFQLTREDQAFVVDRAHIERELYREAKGEGPSTRETMHDACTRYFRSRVSVFDYKGGYTLPQLAIWTPISFERLSVEWTKPHDEVWQRAQELSDISLQRFESTQRFAS